MNRERLVSPIETLTRVSRSIDQLKDQVLVYQRADTFLTGCSWLPENGLKRLNKCQIELECIGCILLI